MAFTRVNAIEWSLKKNGRLIPNLIVEPILLHGRIRKVKRVHAFSAWWVLKKCVGVDAIVFLALGEPKGKPYVKEVNFPMVPDIPTYCKCGKLFRCSGQHFLCNNTQCTFRGEALWIYTQPISWVDASLIHK
jgi:hypothetical protein